jgi:hypothetical protein
MGVAGRTFVIATNALTLLAGFFLIIFGLYELLSPDARLYSNALPLAITTIGGLVILVSIAGCCGALMESKPVLITYFGVLLILVIIQIIAILLALVNTQHVENAIDTAWDKAYRMHPRIIRDIENEYSCCGFRSTTDRAVPSDCADNRYYGWDKPCHDSLRDSYKHHQYLWSILGILLVVIQIMALVCAFLLIRHIPNAWMREVDYRREHERLVNQGRGRTSEHRNEEAPKSYVARPVAPYGSTG